MGRKVIKKIHVQVMCSHDPVQPTAIPVLMF